jgi:ribulose kinase
VAVAAATCAGIYPDLATAAASMTRSGPSYRPDPDAAEQYAGLLRDYIATGDALAALR